MCVLCTGVRCVFCVQVYVTSGLGGMSGAQAKAATIVGCIGVIAEVDLDALQKRYDQGSVLYGDV